MDTIYELLLTIAKTAIPPAFTSNVALPAPLTSAASNGIGFAGVASEISRHMHAQPVDYISIKENSY